MDRHDVDGIGVDAVDVVSVFLVIAAVELVGAGSTSSLVAASVTHSFIVVIFAMTGGRGKGVIVSLLPVLE